jgi:pSer/pThr/pTyr-binding forkhead associated (FHA) protein
MAPRPLHPAADPPRRPARDVIAAVLDNKRRNLEPLKYSTLAPSRYVVYLHPAEYARLEGIIPILQQQTLRALTEELETLNRPSALKRYASRLAGDSRAPVESAGGEWRVEFLPDPDGEVGEGDILVDSELLLPASPELGVGERTRRITTVRSGEHTTARERTAGLTHETALDRKRARIAYEDESGPHTYDIVKDSITIGRGGVAHPVDVRIVSSVDVSREHARIRRDSATGRFFLIDLSSLGTTLNGRHVPRGYDEVDGGRRENNAETPLPDRARIGLADTVYLDFTAGAQ